jgi:hypothetical protein
MAVGKAKDKDKASSHNKGNPNDPKIFKKLKANRIK